MPVDVLVGLQWGDEGKGKIVDYFAPNYDIIARFQGGPNAGHTLVINGKKFVLHTIPSGIIQPHSLNIIGTGLVIDPVTLLNEIAFLETENVEVKSRLIISDKAHLILPTHKMLDKYFEKAKGVKKIGSTLRGIGPTYQDKYARTGLLTGYVKNMEQFKEAYNELKTFHLIILQSLGFDEFDVLSTWEKAFFEAIETMSHLQIEAIEILVNNALKNGKRVLAEGAQGSLLDVTFGSYPYVTSSNTISAAACIGLGIAPQHIEKVIGVFKAYMTRVGEGPFPSELNNEIGKHLMVSGNEYGATTGRERRCGWLDLGLLEQTIIQNGVTDLVITKSDILNCVDQFEVVNTNGESQNMNSWSDDIQEVTKKSELPEALLHYLKHIEEQVELPIRYISTGPQRHQIIIS